MVGRESQELGGEVQLRGRRLAPGEVELDALGDERVARTIESGPSDPARLVKGLLDATSTFTGNRPQADDQTLVVVTVTAPAASANRPEPLL